MKAKSAKSNSGTQLYNVKEDVMCANRCPIWKSLVYGRTVLNFILILLQLSVFALAFVHIIPHTMIVLAAQYVLAALFLIYLGCSKGRNEYKLAWMLPVLLFPLFGIVCYIIAHKSGAPRAVKHRLMALASPRIHQDAHILSGSINGSKQDNSRKTIYPKVDDIAHYLAQTGGFAMYANCDVTYYANGEDAFPVMLERLKNANKFIFMEYFLIKQGWMWARLVEVLSERASSGVEVRLMFDALGSVSMPISSTIKDLKARGIKAMAFAPMVPIFSPYLNNRDHRKIMVIDGDIAFTGGINIGDEYIGRDDRLGKWKDTVVCVRGAAVASFTQMCLRLWDVTDKASVSEGDYFPSKVRTFITPGVVIPYCDDAYNGYDIAEDVYLYLINSAKKYVHITTPYIVLDNQMREALIFAARRGVEVEMIVPRSIDHYLTYCIGRTYLCDLAMNGVRVWEYTPGFIHAKSVIADGDTAVLGTVNMDYRSLYAQFEDALFMHKVPAIFEMESDFCHTRDACRLFTVETYKSSPLIRRALGKATRLFAPLV